MKNKNDMTFNADRVTLCQDGKYRWVYDVNLLTNPSVFITVVKVLLISVIITYAFVLGICLLDGNMSEESFLSLTKVFGIVAAVLLGLGIVGYIVYAIIVGGKYTVLFTLDDNELVHQEYGKTLEKARLIGELSMIAGAAGGSVGGTGTGLLAKSRTSMTTRLNRVRRVKPCRWMNMIKVNERWSRNRVYVKKQDFDFVYNFLCEHCVNRKK